MLIGITLGVTSGSAFNTLLAALSFHQFFEVGGAHSAGPGWRPECAGRASVLGPARCRCSAQVVRLATSCRAGGAPRPGPATPEPLPAAPPPAPVLQGFAIGAAVVDSGLGVMKSVIMGLAYAVTTPTGIAIGEGACSRLGRTRVQFSGQHPAAFESFSLPLQPVHPPSLTPPTILTAHATTGIGMRESFNQNSETTLYVEGIFDSISTGILIYVSTARRPAANSTLLPTAPPGWGPLLGSPAM